MSLQNSLKELFSFSKKERIGFITLLIAIVIVAIVPFVKNKSTATINAQNIDSTWFASANALQNNNADSDKQFIDYDVASHNLAPNSGNGNYSNNHTSNGLLFTFDPNALDAEGLRKLGLRDKTIQTLLNYRNKGGKFRKPDDLSKIYGLRKDEFERLKPYINIPDNNQSRQYTYNDNNTSSVNDAINTIEKPKFKPKSIEVNEADMAAYESLYGIGPKLAAKIINFREKLGGFYSIIQVGETYGIPDSVFQKIKNQLTINATTIKKINLNTATYDELNNHPYISGKTAFQILKYRKEKGGFVSIDQVRNLIEGSDSYEKIANYITAP